MANFDLRKELMEINNNLAHLNALRTENNSKQLEINYQVLYASLKGLLATVKKEFPQYESELLAENHGIIQMLSKGIIAYCPEAYRSVGETRPEHNQGMSR